MTENKRFNDLRGYKRFDSYFDDCMQLWTVSDNENDNMLYPCTSENMANEFTKLLNELNDENKELKETLLSVLNELHTCESSLICEYSSDISNDEKELAELFKEKYSKYGWKE